LIRNFFAVHFIFFLFAEQGNEIVVALVLGIFADEIFHLVQIKHGNWAVMTRNVPYASWLIPLKSVAEQ
jgi:hypothetical protein